MYTKTRIQGKESLSFEWHIPQLILNGYIFNKFTKNDNCSSDIVLHKESQTKWCLSFYPLQTENNDQNNNANKNKNETLNAGHLQLCLLNQSNVSNKIVIIECKELQNKTLLMHLNCHTYLSKSDECFLIPNLQHFQKGLTFVCRINFTPSSFKKLPPLGMS